MRFFWAAAAVLAVVLIAPQVERARFEVDQARRALRGTCSDPVTIDEEGWSVACSEKRRLAGTPVLIHAMQRALHDAYAWCGPMSFVWIGVAVALCLVAEVLNKLFGRAAPPGGLDLAERGEHSWKKLK